MTDIEILRDIARVCICQHPEWKKKVAIEPGLIAYYLNNDAERAVEVSLILKLDFTDGILTINLEEAMESILTTECETQSLKDSATILLALLKTI